MAQQLGMRIQTGAVVLLLAGSVTALSYNTFATLALPQRELAAHEQLREASREMAAEAGPICDSLASKVEESDPANEKLREVTKRVLASHPDVEGGFFLASADRFTGYAFPTGQHAPSSFLRNEPPPLEAPLIRRQAQQSLDAGQALLRTEEVEASQVVILTEPVGEQWPARLTTWVMVRLTGPALLQKQLWRSEISTFLALGGVALALSLTWNLARRLQVQRRKEERLRDDLRHSEHLAMLGRLLAGVAHEVRNPLAAIRSTVQLWERLPRESRTPESVAAVMQAVDRLNGIVTRLLVFSRTDNAERQTLDLHALLIESLDLIRAQAAEQNVRVEQALANRLPILSGSPSALRQVLLNLLTNALQAMPRGGTLTTTTEVASGGRQVVLLVTDTGPGVAGKDRAHLFEPFYTTRADGTGLGLALCREIIVNHGGTIEYLPRNEPGAAFRIVLPAQV